MRTLQIVSIASLLGIAAAPADLLLHYNMEEPSGNLVDQVGGLEAAPVDTGHVYSVAGPTGFGNAVSLSENGAWQLSVADSTLLRSLANNFSVAAWVNVDSLLAGSKTGTNSLLNRIIGDDEAWDGDGWSMGIFSDGRVRFTKNGIVDVDLADPGAVPFDEWAHFAATVSSTAGTTLFINGIAVGSNANTANCNTGVGNNGVDDPFGVGRSYGIGQSQWFAGSLDEVRVFDEVLNQAQIQALMVPVRDPALVVDSVFSGTGDGTVQTFNIEVENGGENQMLDITGINVDGPDAADFVAGELPADLGPGETAQIALQFTPSGGKATYSATLAITSNDPQRPISEVMITIDVFDPQLVVAGVLDFGTVASVTPAMESLAVMNSGGTKNLIIEELTLSGPDLANFSIPAIPDPIGPGGAVDLAIGFTPMGDSGVFSAQLQIVSNDASSPTTVNLLASVANTNLDAHLSSHFTFDSPASLGDDSGRFDNDGTAVGGASFTADARIGDGALLLDGVDDLIRVPGGDDYSGLDDDGDGFSLATWICLDPAAAGNQRIFSTYMDAGFTANGWGVGMTGGSGAALLATTYGVLDFTLPAAVPASSEWHHVTYVYRNVPIDTIDYYVDGVLAGSRTGTAGMNDTTTDFNIGSIGLDGNLQAFFGKIDDLRVYDNELTSADIEEIMAATPEVELRILSISYDGTDVRFTFPSKPGRLYVIERSFIGLPARPLIDWEELDDSYSGDLGETTTFTDSTVPVGTGRVFYRVSLAPF